MHRWVSCHHRWSSRDWWTTRNVESKSLERMTQIQSSPTLVIHVERLTRKGSNLPMVHRQYLNPGVLTLNQRLILLHIWQIMGISLSDGGLYYMPTEASSSMKIFLGLDKTFTRERGGREKSPQSGATLEEDQFCNWHIKKILPPSLKCGLCCYTNLSGNAKGSHFLTCITFSCSFIPLYAAQIICFVWAEKFLSKLLSRTSLWDFGSIFSLTEFQLPHLFSEKTGLNKLWWLFQVWHLIILHQMAFHSVEKIKSCNNLLQFRIT